VRQRKRRERGRGTHVALKLVEQRHVRVAQAFDKYAADGRLVLGERAFHDL
jgi:hypothetical protein